MRTQHPVFGVYSIWKVDFCFPDNEPNLFSIMNGIFVVLFQFSIHKIHRNALNRATLVLFIFFLFNFAFGLHESLHCVIILFAYHIESRQRRHSTFLNRSIVPLK